MLTPKEVDRIRIALGFCLAGEPSEGWPNDTLQVLEAALGKLSTAPTRTVWVPFSKAEATAAAEAIGQMTDGNARDYSEWHKQTHGSPAQWRALISAEAKLLKA